MNPHTWIPLAALAWAAGYALACMWWPFGSCWRCGGTGKQKSPKGKHWRTCRRCKGTGARLRIGRRVLNYYSETARNGTK